VTKPAALTCTSLLSIDLRNGDMGMTAVTKTKIKMMDDAHISRMIILMGNKTRYLQSIMHATMKTSSPVCE